MQGNNKEITIQDVISKKKEIKKSRFKIDNESI